MSPMLILTNSGAMALVALGIAMVRADEFKAARWLFWAAGAVATLYGLWWELTTLDPLLLRILYGAVTAVAVCVLLPMLFEWLSRKEREWLSKKELSAPL